MGKLRADLEEGAFEVFSGAADRERVRSVLADLTKTASDFRAITSRALEQLASAIVPRLRRARMANLFTGQVLSADLHARLHSNILSCKARLCCAGEFSVLRHVHW